MIISQYIANVMNIFQLSIIQIIQFTIVFANYIDLLILVWWKVSILTISKNGCQI